MKKIGFLESLTVINPLNFQCKKCSNYIGLSRQSIKIYILMLIVIFIISFTGFYILSLKKALNRNLLIIIVPIILGGVFLIHYYYWNYATAVAKEKRKGDISELSC